MALPFVDQRTLLLALLFFTAACAAPECEVCDCEVTCAQIVARQRQEIARLQSEVGRLRGGVHPAARRAASASPCDEDWEVTSDADVEALQGCRTIRTLTIRDSSITSLTALSDLKSAESIVIRNNDLLTHLTGLQSLETAGSIVIEENAGLESLTGLEKLQHVTQMLQVSKNPSLRSPAGLPSNGTDPTGPRSLEIAGSVIIEENDALESLAGFEKLKHVTKTLQVRKNPSIQSLTGLDSLETAEEVLIEHSYKLVTLHGLENLTKVARLRLSLNPTLKSIAGLQSLESAEEVDISWNDELESLEGLERLKRTGKRLLLSKNPKLKSLAALKSLEVAEELLISSNNKLKSLAGLEKLTSVGERLEIESNPTLRSLTGLQGLVTAGEIDVEDNSELESLTGLDKLRSIGVWLQVSWNPRLSSLAGLKSLEVAEEIEIDSNHGLESLTGLERLKRVNTRLGVTFNDRLRSLAALNSLESAEEVDIQGNDELESLTGLENLTSVGGSLHVWSNAKLRSIAGLKGLQTAELCSISFNAELESLAGLEKLTRAGEQLEVWQNSQLTSLAGLQGLETAGAVDIKENDKLESLTGLEGLRTAMEFQIVSNWELVDLTALKNLEHVQRELKISGNRGALHSLSGLENLTHVGKLTLMDLWGLQSMTALQNLARAPDGVSITNCYQLHSFEGLGALRSTAELIVEGSRHVQYLGGPFAGGASVGAVHIDEASWPRCVTPHERIALLSVVEHMNASSIPEVGAWRPEECGIDFGTFLCTKGQPCNFSLAGAESSNDTISSVFVSRRFTGCGACAVHHHLRGVIAEGGMVDLGYALKDEQAGLHSICRCAGRVGPVAQLLLRGPRHSGVTACSKGRNCTFRVDGEALEPSDHVVLMSSCSSGNPGEGFKASWAAENVYLLHNESTWYTAPPLYYEVCWRAPCTSAPDGPTCPPPEDTYIHVGEVKLLGAYSSSYWPVLGDQFTVPNVGLGVSDGDRMRLRLTCGQANPAGPDTVDANSSGMAFNFGRLSEDRVHAGGHHLCWCHERRGTKCNEESDFMAEAGLVQILCPAGHEIDDSRRCKMCPPGKRSLQPGLEPCSLCPMGRFSSGGKGLCEACPEGTVTDDIGSSECEECNSWEVADEDAAECVVDPVLLALLILFPLSVGTFCSILVHHIRRPVVVLDVSLVEGRTLVTTFGLHGFNNFGRQSFPVTLHGTGHPGLDSPEEPFRASVDDAVRLVLLTDDGEPIKTRMDTSMGTLTVPFPRDLLHQGWPVPLAVSLPVLLTLIVVLSISVVWAGMQEQAFPLALGTAVVLSAITAAIRRIPHVTPLERRLSEFKHKLEHALHHSKRNVPKGPQRAIAIGKLHELLQFFHDFIRDRTAYYLDSNILKQLTRAKRTSYAELVGAGQVEWFVSHFWGTPFDHFCAALKKHAEMVCGQREWTALRYWVCFCSNNQYQIREELGAGAGWGASSFYLTLKSGQCQGTCMVLDDQALPLTRIWCIFELLQTVKLGRSDEGFQGLLLCTSSGVLNTGGGSAEVAVALAERVAHMDLATAQATSENDAQMIRSQVITEMGSFEALNRFVCCEVRDMLVRAQQNVDAHFAAVLAALDIAINAPDEDEVDDTPDSIVEV